MALVAVPAFFACSAGPSASSPDGGAASPPATGATSGGSGSANDSSSSGGPGGSSGGSVDTGSGRSSSGVGGPAPRADAGASDDGAVTMDVGVPDATVAIDAAYDAAPKRVFDGAINDAAGLAALTVYIAGDSTVSQYVLNPNDPKSWAGWGQMLAPHFNSKVTVVDDAVGGRTALRFIQEGHLAAILNAMKAGDYLLVQFGTNDSNTTATYVLSGVTYPYYAPASGTFKTYLQQYIDGARAKMATVVLVTPPPRNSAYCGGGRSLTDYGQAMIDLGKANGVPVVDLGLRAWTYLSATCPKPATAAQETFFKVLPDGTIDGTHFQENGARMLAGFVADGITTDGLGLAAYRIQ